MFKLPLAIYHTYKSARMHIHVHASTHCRHTNVSADFHLPLPLSFIVFRSTTLKTRPLADNIPIGCIDPIMLV